MSKIISDLLAADEPLFALSLQQLEKVTGNESVDVRLTAEIIGKVRLKSQELGLDPDDSTGIELYQALINRIKKDDLHLAESLGAKEADNVAELIPLMKQKFDDLDAPKGCWVLKKSVAKKFLRESPPPKIMEHLGYRSIDSMLKTENIYEVMGALRFAEGPEWLNQFNEKYKTLTPSDFENRQIEVVIMPHERWADLCEAFVHKKRHNITHLKEMGVILMLPMKMERLTGIAMTCMPLLLHYLNEIRLYSSFFKLKQVQPNFGEVFVNTLIAEPPTAAVLAGQNVHWRVIQRYFGKLENEYHPEIFEPHVQPEDLHWRKAEDILFQIAPELGFWRDLDYVGVMHDDRPVVFNMMDVAMSFSNSTPYAERAIFHFRESLWNEVFIRYLGMPVLEDQVLKQLDNNLIAPEKLV